MEKFSYICPITRVRELSTQRQNRPPRQKRNNKKTYTKMKRNLFRNALVVLAAALVAVACEPDTPIDTPEDPTEKPGEEPGTDPGEEPGEEPDNKPKNYFTMEVGETTPTTAHISVTPTENVTAFYYWDITIDDGFVYDKNFVYDYLDAQYQLALTVMEYTEDEYPYEAYCADMFIPATYSDSFTLTGLQPETGYVAWAVAMDEYGIVCGPVETIKFSTTPVEQLEMTFDVQLETSNADGVRNILTITPSMDDKPYIYYYGGEKEMADFIGNGTIEDALEGLAKYIINWPSELFKGQVEEDCTGYLEDGTNYVWVAGYDGGFTTEVFTFEFEYEYVEPDDNTMTGDILDIHFEYGKAYILGDYGGTYSDVNFCELYLYKDATRNRDGSYSPNFNEDMMELRFFLPEGVNTLDGVFNVGTEVKEYVMQAGYIDEEGYLNGSHYFYSTYYTPYALITGGSMFSEIADFDTSTYNMVLNFTSDGNTITATVAAPIAIEIVNL